MTHKPPQGIDAPNWNRPQDKLSPDGVVVDTLNSHGELVQLKRQGRLWFLPDGSMYVYYEPTFWREQRLAEMRGAKR